MIIVISPTTSHYSRAALASIKRLDVGVDWYLTKSAAAQANSLDHCKTATVILLLLKRANSERRQKRNGTGGLEWLGK